MTLTCHGPRLGRLAAAALLAAALPAGAATYSALVAFGDGLVDDGNLYALTGQTRPGPPYTPGRYSNGPVVAEYLAQMQGVPLVNHAFGGATTGWWNLTSSVNPIAQTGVRQQIKNFQASSGGTADPDALYLLMAGGNDFLAYYRNRPAGVTVAQVSSTAVTNLTQSVSTLYGMGARHFLLPLMPDLGLTPDALSLNALQPGSAAAFSAVSQSFNQALAGAYGQLADSFADERFTIVDSAAVHRALLADFAAQGGVTRRGCFADQAGPACTGYFYVDGSNPTTAVHQGFAQVFSSAVPEPASWGLAAVAVLLAGLATRQRSRG